MANLISFTILVLFLWGRSLRFTDLRLHIFIMLGVIVADLALVFGLVETRDALAKVNTHMSWPLMVHVPIAVFTVLLYFPTAWAGFQLYRGKEAARARLRVLDRILVPARILTLLTSLLVQILK